MNKLFSKIASLSVGLAMAVGVGVALGHNGVREAKAADTTVTWTATAANNLGSSISSAGGTNTGSVTLSDGGSNEFSLSYTRTLVSLKSGKSDYIAFQGSTWIQLGSSNALESLSFTTSAIEGVIKSVTVVAATAGTHKLTIDVGGTKYKDAASLTSYSSNASATNPNPANCAVTGTGESSGALTITIASSATTTYKAMLIRSVSVTYETGVTPTGPFHVTYNGNGATSGSMTDSEEYESGDIVTIMACEFMRDNYSVTGWNTQADGSGTSYVLSGTFEITGNVTLYAQWEYIGPGSSADNPYTVAQAKAAIDAGSFPTPAYVSGIICQVDQYKATYHSIDYWISDDGTTTSMLEAYSGKGIGGADFNAKEDIEVGATVVIKGSLTKYKETYELNTNNELVSYTAPVHEDPTLSLSAVKAHLVSGGASTTVTASFESFSGTPTLSVVSEPQYAYVSFDGATITIQPKAAYGTETITFRATYNSEVADKEFKLVVTTNAGTAGNPFTISEAKAVIDVLENFNGYVLGVVSQVDSFSEQYSSITYWISGDGTTTDQLECYSGKGYNGAAFSAVGDLVVGTTVIVQGSLKVYNETYEFDKNNRIVEFPSVESFGLELLTRTNAVCADYDGKTDNHDAIAGIWTTLAGEGYYADLTSTEKSFLESVEGDKTGDALAQAMARYDYLTGKYELTNFISGRTPVASNYTPAVALGSDNNSYIIIVVISAVSVMSFGLALFLRKKRSK